MFLTCAAGYADMVVGERRASASSARLERRDRGLVWDARVNRDRAN